jgi:hypothetical protein
VGGVLSLITVSGLVLGFVAGTWDGFWGMLVVTALYFLKIYSYDLQYSVAFNDGNITMHVATWQSSPSALTTIRVADITSIKRETSDLRTIAAQRRVTQRIAIYDDTHQKFIDVSLKHFTSKDIRTLMQMIHKERPDLAIPEGWS